MTKLAGCVFLGSLIALVLGVSTATAAEDIAGAWQATMDFNGSQMAETLTIAKKADGSLTGRWGAMSELKSVKFEGDKLTFSRTIQFGDQTMTHNFTGTVKDGKITGTMGDENFQMPVTAVRKKALAPAVGQWDITYKAGSQEATARVIIGQKADGTLTGQWTKEPGQVTVSNVKSEGDKLTFTRKADTESTFEGTVKGDELTGTLKGPSGAVPVAGKRFGAALIGTWILTSNAEGPFNTSALIVDPNLGGSYEMFSEIPLKSLKLEGDQVTFSAEMPFGDQVTPLDFKGKLEGKTLKGTMTTPQGTNEITGKKAEAIAAAAPKTN